MKDSLRTELVLHSSYSYKKLFNNRLKKALKKCKYYFDQRIISMKFMNLVLYFDGFYEDVSRLMFMLITFLANRSIFFAEL
jgi:hypothetical protein